MSYLILGFREYSYWWGVTGKGGPKCLTWYHTPDSFFLPHIQHALMEELTIIHQSGGK